MNNDAAEAAIELRKRIKQVMRKEPSLPSRAMGDRVGCSQSCAYKHMRAIRDDADGRDNENHKENAMAAKPKQADGGGDSEDDQKDALITWYENREKELLEALAVLSLRFIKALERVDDLEASTTPAESA